MWVVRVVGMMVDFLGGRLGWLDGRRPGRSARGRAGGRLGGSANGRLGVKAVAACERTAILELVAKSLNFLRLAEFCAPSVNQDDRSARGRAGGRLGGSANGRLGEKAVAACERTAVLELVAKSLNFLHLAEFCAPIIYRNDFNGGRLGWLIAVAACERTAVLELVASSRLFLLLAEFCAPSVYRNDFNRGCAREFIIACEGTHSEVFWASPLCLLFCTESSTGLVDRGAVRINSCITCEGTATQKYLALPSLLLRSAILCTIRVNFGCDIGGSCNDRWHEVLACLGTANFEFFACSLS